jgi:hypothetical protein
MGFMHGATELLLYPKTFSIETFCTTHNIQHNILCSRAIMTLHSQEFAEEEHSVINVIICLAAQRFQVTVLKLVCQSRQAQHTSAIILGFHRMI